MYWPERRWSPVHSRLDRQQLKRILDAGRGLVADLDPESVLRRVLEDARDLTGARYAAMGILDEEKRRLERFLVSGIDADGRRAIGQLPHGHGVLGELIRNPAPLRIANLGEHPRSYGFPPNHPPMTTFLGVPIVIRGEAFGNLYLTDKESGEEFAPEDEELLVVLAEWAAIAIDNARNYERAEARRAELERAVRGLQTTAALSRELAGESDPSHVLDLVAKRGRALLEAGSLAIVFREDEELVVAEAAGEVRGDARGRRLPLRGSPIADVLRAGSPRHLSEPALNWLASAGVEGGAAIAAPLPAAGEADGAIVAIDGTAEDGGFSHDDLLLLGSFAGAAGAAIAASTSLEHEKLELSIAASENERRRWARELHDETLQELGALKMIQQTAIKGGDPEAQRRALETATSQVERMIQTLEGLITELRPAALDQLGAQAAVESLLDRVRERQPLEIHADFDLAYESGRAEARHAPELETTIYRVVQEALNNVVKHAEAEHARIAITESQGQIVVIVEDDGRGIRRNGGGDRSGFGLLGMRERVSLAGGQMKIGAGTDGGTRLTVTLPTGSA